MLTTETLEKNGNGNGLSKIIIVALLAGIVSFWSGFALRASEIEPAYTKTEIDLMFANVSHQLTGISNQLSDLKVSLSDHRKDETNAK